jgi:monofunctional biosynthetic peptidoglycan transglycosylase
VRRLARGLLGLAIVATLCGVLPILAMRIVPPFTSAFMLQKQWPFASGEDRCARVEYDWVPRSQIAPSVFRAVLAAEDQRFAQHDGFDFHAIEEALEERGRGSARGASTISQQVAKNLFLWPARSWVRKGAEVWLTVWIELFWPKQRILEVYVNVAQFGPCTFGVAAASRRFFDVEPSRLDLAQASLLAAVLPNPVQRRVDAPSPKLRKRAAWIARQARTVTLESLSERKASH